MDMETEDTDRRGTLSQRSQSALLICKALEIEVQQWVTVHKCLWNGTTV